MGPAQRLLPLLRPSGKRGLSRQASPLKVAPRTRGQTQQGVKKPRVRMFRPRQLAHDSAQQPDLRMPRLQAVRQAGRQGG